MIRGKHWDDGWLTAYWGKEYRGSQKDLMFGSPCRPDGHLLYGVMCFDLLSEYAILEELKAMGYVMQPSKDSYYFVTPAGWLATVQQLRESKGCEPSGNSG